MEPLWSSEEMVQIVGARPLGNLPEAVSGVCTDPRFANEGCAFFAIKTDSYDGHDHMTAAAKAGVALAVVDEDRLVALGHTRLPLLVVNDVAEAMRLLAAAGRARSPAKVIAVTGSAGKTTTIDMLKAILSKAGEVHRVVLTPDSVLQPALALASLPAQSQFCIVEIPAGGGTKDDMALLGADVVVVTNAGGGKSRLEAWLQPVLAGLKKGGTVLINHDDRNQKAIRELAKKSRVKRVALFGSRKGSDFLLRGREPVANGQKLTIEARGKGRVAQLGAEGKHMALNALAALAAATIAGGETDAGLGELTVLLCAKGRGRICELAAGSGTFTLIDDSAHANAVSMKAALESLGETRPGAGGARIAVLGDMDDASKAQHVALSKLLVECGADKVYLAGPQMKHLAEQLEPSLLAGHFNDAASLDQALSAKIASGDVVLVKAREAMEFGGIVETLAQQDLGRRQDSPEMPGDISPEIQE